MDGEPDVPEPGGLTLLAVAASLLLCWILYRVRMRECEAILREVAKALDEVRSTAEALQTRRQVVRAATVTAQKALQEYNVFLNMLQEMQEGDFHRPDLPILRHQLEVETMRAQVSMVQGCLLAMSQEVLNLGVASANEPRQEKTLTSLQKQQKSYMHLSEELLSLLNKQSSEHVKLLSAEEERGHNNYKSELSL